MTPIGSSKFCYIAMQRVVTGFQLDMHLNKLLDRLISFRIVTNYYISFQYSRIYQMTKLFCTLSRVAHVSKDICNIKANKNILR